MIIKCISGAQTGSDISGLFVAEKFGISTGGWCPKNCRTEIGDKPEWIKRFNLQETRTNNYVPRTYVNAKLGDGTIRFAYNFNSPGEICTKKACEKYNKPIIDVNVENPCPVEEVVVWIQRNNIQILNIAGNRESVYPGIGKFVEEFLSRVFVKLGEEG